MNDAQAQRQKIPQQCTPSHMVAIGLAIILIMSNPQVGDFWAIAILENGEKFMRNVETRFSFV